MIQRIQTVYLLLAIVCMTCFQLAPLIGEEFKGHYEPTQGYNVLHSVRTPDGVYKFYFTVIFGCTAIGFALISIFLFKKRSIQQLLVICSAVFTATSAIYIYYKYQTMVFPGDVIYTPWNILAFAALLLEVLAIAAIRKDEKAVQELNTGRLR